MKRLVVAILLLVGIGLWWTIGERAPLHLAELIGILCGFAFCLTPATWEKKLERLPIGLIIFVLGTLYLLFSGYQQHRFIGPQSHDEHMHLLQMQMLAHGRLWYPQHELADFFESFHIFVKPLYASIYFPGTALLYLPAVWLSLPFWLMPLLVAGVCLTLLHSIIREIVSPLAGLVAVLMLVGVDRFQNQSLTVLSHLVMLFLGLMLVWTWLRWRRRMAMSWAILLGVVGGWALITRPLDAVCYGLPIAGLVLWELRGKSPRAIATNLSIMCISALPFLALQLIQNLGVTGHLLKTPYSLYADQFTPGMTLGFHEFNPNTKPQTDLLQRQLYYQQFTAGAVKQHEPRTLLRTWYSDRLPALVKATLPHPVLLVVYPIGLLALADRRRMALWLNQPIFVIGYIFFAYFLVHYGLVVAPSMILTLLLGATVVATVLPRQQVNLMLFLMMGFSIGCLPQFHAARRSPAEFDSVLTAVNLHLRENVQPPAIVLFRFREDQNVHDEPVYNVDVVNPDDAPIIRAHDLGARNKQLFAYYAQRQPRRFVYLFDRAAGTLTPLGTVADLARVP